jgi:hypothetical protein
MIDLLQNVILGELPVRLWVYKYAHEHCKLSAESTTGGSQRRVPALLPNNLIFSSGCESRDSTAKRTARAHQCRPV